MSESLARILYDSVNSRVAKFIDDSGDSLLGIASKLRNAAGTIVNPATEDTLSAADTKLGTIDGVLDAIKDTDGVKKIVDPLPAGTNNIGDVDVVSSALPTGAATETTLAAIKAKTDNIPADPAREGGNLASLAAEDFATETTLLTRATQTTAAAIQTVLEAIRDTAGVKKIVDALPIGDNIIGRAKITDGTNTVGVLDDSGTYRLRVDAKIAAGNANLQKVYLVDGVNEIELAAVPDAVIPANTRSLLAAGTDGASARVLSVTTEGVLKVTQARMTEKAIIQKLAGPGGITNMNVDGSGTPVSFVFGCDPTDDIYLNALRIILLPNVLRMDGSSFGSLVGPLTNGCRLAVTTGGTECVIGLFKQTEDLVALPGGAVSIETQLPANDLLMVELACGGAVKLTAGTSDKVELKIQDDLTGAGPNSIVTFTATILGTKG